MHIIGLGHEMIKANGKFNMYCMQTIHVTNTSAPAQKTILNAVLAWVTFHPNTQK